MRKKVIVFDLDGTVIDSAGIISEVVNEAFAHAGVEGVFEARHVGPPLEQMIANAAPEMSAEQLAVCVERFRERYEGQAARTPVYEGALAVIDRLAKDNEVWLATYKRRSATDIILAASGLGERFGDRTLCADDRGGMSKAEMLQWIKSQRPGAWLAMVGDTQSDHDAAAAAGFDAFALASWGAALPVALSEELALVHSRSFSEFESELSGLMGRIE